MRGLLLWASQNQWLAQRLPRYRFVQRAVTRFMPGEELEAALRESQAQKGKGTPTSGSASRRTFWTAMRTWSPFSPWRRPSGW